MQETETETKKQIGRGATRQKKYEISQHLGFQSHSWVIVSPCLVMSMLECPSNCSGQGSGKTNELEVSHTLHLPSYTD